MSNGTSGEGDYDDLVEFTVAVNALLRRAQRLLRMSRRGLPKKMLVMETSMAAEAASRVAVVLAKSPEKLDDDTVSAVYQTQYHHVQEGDDADGFETV